MVSVDEAAFVASPSGVVLLVLTGVGGTYTASN